MGSVGTDSFLTVAEKAVESTVLSLSWIPSSARMVALGTCPKGKGLLEVYGLEGRKLTQTASLNHSKPFRCGTFDVCDASERVFCCGDMSGAVSLWDIESQSQSLSFRGHDDVINSIVGGGAGSSEILTGGRDGEAKLWDRRSPHSAVVRMLPESGESRRDCWTVAHSGPSLRTLAAGFDNGDIKVFDLRNTKLAWETSLGRGVSSIIFLPGADDDGSDQRARLVAGTVQGKLMHWCLQSPGKPAATLLDNSTVWATQALQADLLVSCLGSGALCVSRAAENRLESVARSQVSEPPLTGLAVSPDKPGLVATSSFDKTIRVHLYTGT